MYFASERRRWQSIAIDKVGACEGLPSVAHKARMLHRRRGQSDGVARYNGGGGIVHSLFFGYLEGRRRFSVGGGESVGVVETYDECVALALHTFLYRARWRKRHSVGLAQRPTCQTLAYGLLALGMYVERVAAIACNSHAGIVDVLHQLKLAVAEPRP